MFQLKMLCQWKSLVIDVLIDVSQRPVVSYMNLNVQFSENSEGSVINDVT